MEIKTKKLADAKIEMEIEASEDEFKRYIDSATIEMGKGVTIEGFRKGMAPKDIVEKHIGKDHIVEHAAEHAVESLYRKAVEQLNIEPIDRPEAEVVKLAPGNPFVFKVTVQIIPEMELPDYKAIVSNIKKEKAVVEEKEIGDTLNWLQRSRAKYSLKNAPAEKGDLVEIEYFCPQIPEIPKEGQKDGFILGEGQFIPGFEENIFGMEVNGEKTFSVEVPSDYPVEAIKGKKLDFTIKVKSVQNRELPEINDEFVKTLGKFENIEELKKNISDGILLEKEESEKQKLRDKILDEISKESKFEIPEILIRREKEAMVENVKHEVSHKFNIPFEQYLKQIGKTEENFISSLEDEAKNRVKKFLILREIGIKEGVEVSDDEIEEEVKNVLKRYPDIKTAEEKIDLGRLREYNKGVIKNEKIFKILEDLTK